VTIAAGFKFRDGVLLCADSEHVGYEHTVHDAKIFSVDCAAGKACFTFAGNPAFAKAAIYKCKQRLRSIQPSAQNPPIFEIISKTLEKEYHRQVLSVPTYANDSSYAYRLLVAIWSPQEPLTLYVTEGPSIWPASDHECIGVGEPLSLFLVQPLLVDPAYLSLERTVTVATYMLYKVKGFVPACGGMSQLLGIFDDGSYGEVRWWEIMQMEDAFKALDSVFSLIVSSTTDSQATDTDFQAAIETVTADMRSIRESCKAVRSTVMDQLLGEIRLTK